MTDTGSIRWVLVFSEIWRSAGWDSLLYLAAIIAIDQALYDAAEIDGANRWQKICYVTIPGIVPTIATLFILNMGMFLSADLNQVINFQNDVNRGHDRYPRHLRLPHRPADRGILAGHRRRPVQGGARHGADPDGAFRLQAPDRQGSLVMADTSPPHAPARRSSASSMRSSSRRCCCSW